MKVEMRKVADLVPYERNAKMHNETQIKNVAESIKRFGFVQPVVIDGDGVIVIGHCRTEAAKLLEMDEVPCVCVDDLTEKEVNALRIIDNKTNESSWDENLLPGELADLDLSEFDLDWGDDEDYSPDDFGEDFALADGDKPDICQMTFTLHAQQKELIEYAISIVKDDCAETFGNTNKNGNGLYEVVRQWAELRK